MTFQLPPVVDRPAVDDRSGDRAKRVNDLWQGQMGGAADRAPGTHPIFALAISVTVSND